MRGKLSLLVIVALVITGEGDHCGHILKRNKTRNTIRVLLNNVGGIGFVSGERSKESLKMERLRKMVIKTQ